MKTCKQCDKDISGMSSRAVYCSRACKDKTRDRQNHLTMDEWLELNKDICQKKREATAKRKEKERQDKMRTAACSICGIEFNTLQPSQVTCSNKCSNKWRNRLADRRINKLNMVDADITLQKLFKRDGGVCYLCGGMCEWDDKEIRDGHTVHLNNYPSIEHVIPLSRGGEHSWNNVRLSHRYCNAIKSDDLPVNVKPIKNAYILAKKPSPRRKTVIQCSLDGQTVATYESTVEAENKTGVKQKGIQNCARQECKTYRGFVWKYISL